MLSSRQLLKDRWIDVRVDRCQTGAGAIVDPFYIYTRPDWACVLAVDAEERAVIVRCYRHGIRALSLEIPAGAIDPDDASPADGVRRELLEETGYRCGTLHPVARLASNPANTTSYVHVFVARGATQVQAPQLEPGETMATGLMTLPDLKAQALSGGIIHGVQTAAILLALEALAKLPRDSGGV